VKVKKLFCMILVMLVFYSLRGEEMIGKIDLNGTWRMKDFTLGMGLKAKLYLPENMPKETLPYHVPGTVRTALLDAGAIPDPYFGYDNEKSLWIEEKEWWLFKKFPRVRRCFLPGRSLAERQIDRHAQGHDESPRVPRFQHAELWSGKYACRPPSGAQGRQPE
jgi:hypothetical protein